MYIKYIYKYRNKLLENRTFREMQNRTFREEVKISFNSCNDQFAVKCLGKPGPAIKQEIINNKKQLQYLLDTKANYALDTKYLSQTNL